MAGGGSGSCNVHLLLSLFQEDHSVFPDSGILKALGSGCCALLWFLCSNRLSGSTVTFMSWFMIRFCVSVSPSCERAAGWIVKKINQEYGDDDDDDEDEYQDSWWKSEESE
jgi:hypothetical protein